MLMHAVSDFDFNDENHWRSGSHLSLCYFNLIPENRHETGAWMWCELCMSDVNACCRLWHQASGVQTYSGLSATAFCRPRADARISEQNISEQMTRNRGSFPGVAKLAAWNVSRLSPHANAKHADTQLSHSFNRLQGQHNLSLAEAENGFCYIHMSNDPISDGRLTSARD